MTLFLKPRRLFPAPPKLCDAPATKEALRSFYDALVVQHRHADTLLNSRLQVYIVGTSVLVAGYSQFRETQYFWRPILIAVSGLVSGLVMYCVLGRTVLEIEWHLDAIQKIENVLFPDYLRPYSTRREMRIKHPLIPVSNLLGHVIPLGGSLFWLCIIAMIIGQHFR